jgi:hypothetical protein
VIDLIRLLSHDGRAPVFANRLILFSIVIMRKGNSGCSSAAADVKGVQRDLVARRQQEIRRCTHHISGRDLI